MRSKKEQQAFNDGKLFVHYYQQMQDIENMDNTSRCGKKEFALRL